MNAARKQQTPVAQTPVARRKRVFAARADIGWSLALLVLVFAAMSFTVDLALPKAYDNEFGSRLALLKERMAEHPNRPLLLGFGSSRVGMGFHPESMPELKTAAGEIVLAFNHSHMAAGPIFLHMQLDRLLRHGVKPKWMFVEVAPIIMSGESSAMAPSMAGVADLRLLSNYFSAGRLASIFLRGRTNPFFKHRQVLLEEFAPALACPRQGNDRVCLKPCGGDDEWMVLKNPTPEEIRRRTDRALAVDRERIADWRVDATVDRALHDLLAKCRNEGIRTALVIMPESSEYRRLYSPESDRRVKDYLARIASEFEIPSTDARDWLPDDAFIDGHHQFNAGGVAFSKMFASRFLQSWIAEETSPSRPQVVLQPVSFSSNSQLR